MSWKDRAKPVQASSSWKDRAKKVEPEKGFLESAAETFSDASRGIQEGIPGYGLIQKAAAGTGALIEEGLERLGADYVGEKDIAQRYEELLAADIAKDKAASERSPIANTIGNVAGSLVAPTPTKGGALGRIATNAGVAAADQATRSEELIDVERGKDAGLLAGGISAGVEALPYVGKVAKAARRVAPGQADSYQWANTLASEAAGINPMNKASATEVNELLSDVASRRAARGLEVDQELVKVKDKLQGADEVLKQRVSDEYNLLQNEALTGPVERSDLKAIQGYVDTLKKTTQQVTDRPELYKSDTKNIITRIESIIRKGSPQEAERGIRNAGKAIDEIKNPAEATRLMRYRLLDARREIDDFMKNKNWDNLLKNDRDAIQKLRDQLNQKLQKELTGSDRLAAADELWSDTVSTLEDTFKKIQTDGKIDPTKLKSNLNPELARGIQFNQSKDKLKAFLDKAEKTLGEIPEMRQALSELDNLQRLVKQKAQMEIADRSVGGPTGQGANLVLQYFAAGSTGGFSLLLLPVTNPALYTRLIDGLAEAVGKVEANRFAKAMQKASKAALEKSPDVVTRIYAIENAKDNP